MLNKFYNCQLEYYSTMKEKRIYVKMLKEKVAKKSFFRNVQIVFFHHRLFIESNHRKHFMTIKRV